MGLAELLASAAVPKGSFYHYFTSKDDFGCQLLASYVDQYLARLDHTLGQGDWDMRARLMYYWSAWVKSQGSGDPAQQCLVVKIGAEISDLSDGMRRILDEGTAAITARLSAAIAEGQAEGGIDPGVKADVLGPALYQMWLGASLLAKLARSPEPLHHAMEATQSLLPPPCRAASTEQQKGYDIT